MIKSEQVTVNNRVFLKTYSDEGYKLEQTDTGVIYGSEVFDVLNTKHTYSEMTEKEEIKEET